MLINMALLNLINNQFAKELSDFQNPKGEPLVRCRNDHTLALIDVGDDHVRAFRRIDVAVDEKNTGGKAIAFEEVAASGVGKDLDATNVASLTALKTQPLRILFAGLSDDKDSGLGKADKRALLKIIDGKRSPQAELFVDGYMQSLVTKHLLPADANIQLFGHSMGAPNALHAKHFLDTHGYRDGSETILFEPLGAAAEAHFIVHDAKNVGDKTDEAEFVKKLAANVATVRADPPTGVAELYLNNDVGNKPFGEQYFTITHDVTSDPKLRGKIEGSVGVMAVLAAAKPIKRLIDSRSSAISEGDAPEQFPRRQFLTGLLKGAAVAASVNTGAWVGGKVTQFNDSTYHDTAANACKLYVDGDSALTKRITNDVIPSLDELKFPDRYVSVDVRNSIINSTIPHLM